MKFKKYIYRRSATLKWIKLHQFMNLTQLLFIHFPLVYGSSATLKWIKLQQFMNLTQLHHRSRKLESIHCENKF